jgi:magnesium-protoporphyrin O-methyltransferase
LPSLTRLQLPGGSGHPGGTDVNECCAPRGFEELFGPRAARRAAQRYRRKGLDRTAATMVAFLRERGLAGRTLLEVGGGVGAIEIELLRAGAGRAVNVELSTAYDFEASALAKEAGLQERLERRYGDFAAGMFVAPADVVLMHRVVCCYPDPGRLVGAAAELARGYLVMSFPRESRLVRLGIALSNAWHRRTGFRAYVHPLSALVAPAESRGLRPAFDHRGRIWHVVAFERA